MREVERLPVQGQEPDPAVAGFGPSLLLRRRWALDIASYLGSSQSDRWLRQRAADMRRCRSWAVVGYSEDGWTAEATETCKNPLCPQCRHERSRQWQMRIAHAMERPQEAGLFPLFLTLTIKNVPQLFTRDPQTEEVAWHVLRDHVQKAWRTMRETARRRPDSDAGRIWRHVKAGAKVIEITFNRKTRTWHPHIHVLMLCDVSYIDQRDIKRVWEHYSGGRIVYIERERPLPPIPGETTEERAVRQRIHAVGELIKYISKPLISTQKGDADAEPGSLPAAKWRHLAHAVRGRRLIATFGIWRGLRTPQAPEPDPQVPTTHQRWSWRPGVSDWRMADWWGGPGVMDGRRREWLRALWRVVYSDHDAERAREAMDRIKDHGSMWLRWRFKRDDLMAVRAAVPSA
jgi:hypothetical protein